MGDIARDPRAASPIQRRTPSEWRFPPEGSLRRSEWIAAKWQKISDNILDNHAKDRMLEYRKKRERDLGYKFQKALHALWVFHGSLEPGLPMEARPSILHPRTASPRGRGRCLRDRLDRWRPGQEGDWAKNLWTDEESD